MWLDPQDRWAGALHRLGGGLLAQKSLDKVRFCQEAEVAQFAGKGAIAFILLDFTRIHVTLRLGTTSR
jgi:hypothetical protein